MMKTLHCHHIVGMRDKPSKQLNYKFPSLTLKGFLQCDYRVLANLSKTKAF